MATTDKLRPAGSKNAWTWAIITRKAFVTTDIGGGESAAHAYDMAAGLLPNDVHIDRVGVTLENAPSVGKTVTVTVSDGVTTMTVNITGDTDISGFTTTNNYDWDVSEKPLEVRLTTTGGTAAGCCSIVIAYHEITIT